MTSKLFLLLTVLVIFILISCSLFQTKQFSLKDDQYWAQLVKESTDTKKSILDVVKKRNQSLYAQMINDSKDPQLLSFWGQSQNIDSGAKKQIIQDEISADLHDLFGLKTDNLIVHAGIAHTYGYLFSMLDTPYGYKRKRWILPTLNHAFSLKENGLSPETSEGGLLSNVTYFIGALAFKNDSDRLTLKSLKNVSSEIKNFNYYSLTVEHLEEELLNFTLRTTLLRFPLKKETEENGLLLIYSILNHKLKKELLITAFPIKEDAYQKITAPDSLGANQPIAVRYNAYLEGFMDQKLIGNRKLFKELR